MDLMNLLLVFIFGACLTEAQTIAAPYITGTSPLNSTSFTVNWTTSDPSYNINYTVIWTNLNTSVVDSFTVPENTSSYTVTGLNGIHNYNVSVRANNNTGGTNTSDSVTVYVPPTAAPTNIIFPPANITKESFIVEWDEVNNIFTVNYTVRWYGEDGSNGTATVNGLSYTVTGLTANTSYNVTVVAINTCCGAGPVSDVVMVMTNMISPTTTSITPTPTPTTTPSGGGSGPASLSNGVFVATACVITFIVTLIVA